METLLTQLTHLISIGKINAHSPYPPDMKGMPGAAEITAQALAEGFTPADILDKGLLPGMNIIGEKFSQGQAFIANMLISAQAMNAAMEHLRPFFESGEIQSRGTIILGTVQGDLHDIGKNLVKMIMKGDGWDVIDLGTDVDSAGFVEAVKKNPDACVGMIALLTTTMLNMKAVTDSLRDNDPSTKIFIGGAPVSAAFAEEIGADGYFRDPYGLARSLRTN